MSIPYSTQVVSPPEENMPTAAEQLQDAPAQKKKSGRKWLSLVFRLACTVGLFTFLLKSVSWSNLLQNILHLDDGVLLVAVMVGVLGVVISSYQWQVLLDGEHIHIDLRRLVNLYLVGIAFNHFLPTGMGGDVVKVYYVGREGKNVAGSASAAMMSRITGFVGMLFISIPALFIWHVDFTHDLTVTYLLSCLAMCAALAITVALVALLPRILKGKWATWPIFASIRKVGNAVLVTLRRPRSMTGSILFGALFHLSSALNYYAFSLALHMQVPVTFFLVAIPFVSLVAFLPLSINGFGLRESALIYIFSTLHVPATTSLLLVLLVDAQSLLFAAIGGGLYLAMGRANTRHTPAPAPLSIQEASA
jgi:uncharacterized protein (TIRG00374 family)